MNPLGLPALISPYPGGKGGPRYFRRFGPQWQSLICDRPSYYDCIVEPFAGSGAVTWQHHHGIKNAIAADCDPGVQAVWQCWGSPLVLRKLEQWYYHVKEEPQSAFDILKAIYENNLYPEALAAAYLTLKRLVFGGVLRCNKQGKLNVALHQDKLEKYLAGWTYEWPDNGIESLAFKYSWQEAVQALADSSYERALVVIDPPYYSNKVWIEERKDGSQRISKMTAAYPEHNPQSDAELKMCVDCLDAVLATGKALRVVVFNYHSDELKRRINTLVEKSIWCGDCVGPAEASNLGPLGNMNNAQKFHGRDDEWVWEIGGQRMFRNHDAVEQLAFA